MPVAGMVITFCEDEGLRACAVEALAADPRITLGEAQRGRKLPLVTDTETLEEQQDLWRALVNIPGVLTLDLAFEDFSDVGEFRSDELPSRWNKQPRQPEDDHGSA